MKVPNCGPLFTESSNWRTPAACLLFSLFLLCGFFFNFHYEKASKQETSFFAKNSVSNSSKIKNHGEPLANVTSSTLQFKNISTQQLASPPTTQTAESRLCENGCNFSKSEALHNNIVAGSASVNMMYLKSEAPAASHTSQSNLCEKNECAPSGSEALPKGIVSRTSNFEMISLNGAPLRKSKGKAKPSRSLLAMAVGIKQKNIVDKIVKKFVASDFVIMLFHYDGVVNEWSDLPWSSSALHVSAINQTKWWFAKRFLHPDIVGDYDYIFLWDEDLGVEHFHLGRYLSIIKREGLEISQPALDTKNSHVHYQITGRLRKGDVHRRIYKEGNCNDKSTSPPCTGFVEMMAPVFTKAAWRCVWHMIQNDFIHAWGLDIKLGYCAQGDRSKTVGVVDREYIVHKGIPTLGGSDNKDNQDSLAKAPHFKTDPPENSAHKPSVPNYRTIVRMRSYREMAMFKRRWQQAVAEDKCWIDPYPEPSQ